MRILFRGCDSGNKMDKQKKKKRKKVEASNNSVQSSLRLFFTCQVHTCSFAVLMLYEQWRLIHEDKKNSCVAQFFSNIRRKQCTICKNVSEIISTNLVSKRPLVPSWSLPRHVGEYSCMYVQMKPFWYLNHSVQTSFTVSLSYKTVERTVFKTRRMHFPEKKLSDGT